MLREDSSLKSPSQHELFTIAARLSDRSQANLKGNSSLSESLGGVSPAIVRVGRGTRFFERWFIMSILNSITDTTPVALQRSTRLFARGIVRAVNNFVATIIAQREQQANLTILRSLSDRELRDMGLTRSQVAGGLAEAAKERARLQRGLASRT